MVSNGSALIGVPQLGGMFALRQAEFWKTVALTIKLFGNKMTKKQADLSNETVKNYSFLTEMYEDEYFPNKLVDKCKAILVTLCFQIEGKKPDSLDKLYELTHSATDKFNALQEEFDENDSEIETVARDCIGTDFEFIAKSYGFESADTEELIATRDW